MKYTALRSKIHSAKVTERRFKYEGSIEIDEDLLNAGGFKPHEKVLVANFTNGFRYETYLIKGEAGSGIVAVTGGGARYSCIGDIIAVFAFGTYEEDEEAHPTVVLVNDKNKIKEIKTL